MGWSNPPIAWGELEPRLSARSHPDAPRDDGPITRKRKAYRPRDEVRPPATAVTPYAELHCHSNFSFLDGASGPDALVEQAVRLGLHGLALTDHDGFAGAPLFAEIAQKYAVQGPASKTHSLKTLYGAELSLGLTAPQAGVPDPEGQHLLVLAEGVEGYHRLAAAITEAQLRGDEKGKPVYDLDELAGQAGEQWQILTGCRKGLGRTAEGLDRLVDLFGGDNVCVELTDHGHPGDDVTNDA